MAFQRQMALFVTTDFIQLSSGETVNPFPIEERVRTRIPIVRYAMLVGQDAPYLCALLTLKVPTEQDSDQKGRLDESHLVTVLVAFFFCLITVTKYLIRSNLRARRFAPWIKHLLLQR